MPAIRRRKYYPSGSCCMPGVLVYECNLLKNLTVLPPAADHLSNPVFKESRYCFREAVNLRKRSFGNRP
ncbi:hypothetical protein HDF12_000193 [Edaphobacter lichenicola]|uniref:Uncharacterized protein n=2 Tax=Tunturiibacter TaxID=3154218 RepID=A0A7Y9T0Y8_9BACT|nr:hypothetical protein [Edaphobacter lichenicola]NYF49828.1 hypothetical protein [Edaphobacter lichenicola]